MKPHLLFLTLFFLYFHNYLYSQPGSSYDVPKYTMPSPSITEFIRQAEFPVSNFTGTVNISIPIYTIKSGDLELPISATYITNGIKVNQEASAIGLGWNLNAGGFVSRVINGNDDLGEYEARTRICEGFPETRNFDPYITNTCWRSENGMRDKIMNIFEECDEKRFDTEPDYFYFSFGKVSGQFVLPLNTAVNCDLEEYQPLIIGDSNVDIKLIRKQTNSGNIHKFIISDIDGTKYYFGTSEKSVALSNSVSSYKPLYDPNRSWKYEYGQVYGQFVQLNTSTWLLDSIVSIKNDKILFKYGNKTYTSSKNSMDFNFTGDVDENGAFLKKRIRGCYNTYSGFINENLMLETIEFANGKLNFISDQRFDLEKTDPDSTNLHDGNYPAKLSKIEVRSTITDKLIRVVDFKQDYFNNFYGIEEEFNIDRATKNTRLKLNGISFKDINAITQEDYDFTYNPGILPSKESFAIDHWGYYNGATGSRSLLPAKGFDGTDYNFPEGANRDVNSATTQYGILKSIKYPTKGTVTFEFGPNIYESKFQNVPISFATVPISSVAGDLNDKRAIALYVSKNSLNVNWNVYLQYAGYSYDCKNANWLLTNPNENINNFLISGVLKVNASEMNLPTLFDTEPTTESIVNITDNQQLENIALLFENYTPLKVNQLPNDINELCQDYVECKNNLNLEQGWYIFYASKANNESLSLNLTGELVYPDQFANREIIQYGPGIRIESQTLDDGRNKEVTNYQYESKENTKTGKLILKPKYHSTFGVIDYTYNGNGYIRELHSLFDLSSHSVADVGSVENRGVFGYEKVTITKNNGVQNGKSKYYYNVGTVINSSMPSGLQASFTRIPYNLSPMHGLLFKEEYKNESDSLVSSKEYEYNYIIRGELEGVKFMNRNYLTKFFGESEQPPRLSLDNEACGDDAFWGGMNLTFGYYFNRYSLESNVSLLKKTIEKNYFTDSEGKKIFTEKETKYEYNTDYLLPIKISTNLVSNFNVCQKDIVFNKYPFSYTLTDPNDPISKMKQRANYQIGKIVETQYWKEKINGSPELVGGQITDFNQKLLPNKIYSIRPKAFSATPILSNINDTFSTKLTSGWQYDQEISLQYNNAGNVEETKKLDGPSSKYYWAYNKAYPVIKADNITVDLATIVESSSVLPSGFLNLESFLLSLNNISFDNNQKLQWKLYNDNLRNSLPNAMVTTYTYDPLIGVTSITDPKGDVIYYNYDAFGRLQNVKDKDGKILSENEYHYKN